WASASSINRSSRSCSIRCSARFSCSSPSSSSCNGAPRACSSPAVATSKTEPPVFSTRNGERQRAPIDPTTYPSRPHVQTLYSPQNRADRRRRDRVVLHRGFSADERPRHSQQFHDQPVGQISLLCPARDLR